MVETTAFDGNRAELPASLGVKNALLLYVLKHSAGWEIRMKGHASGSFITTTKDEAIAAAARAANEYWTKHGCLSGVRVQLQSGEWQEERTYGRDPFPPSG